MVGVVRQGKEKGSGGGSRGGGREGRDRVEELFSGTQHRPGY